MIWKREQDSSVQIRTFFSYDKILARAVKCMLNVEGDTESSPESLISQIPTEVKTNIQIIAEAFIKGIVEKGFVQGVYFSETCTLCGFYGIAQGKRVRVSPNDVSMWVNLEDYDCVDDIYTLAEEALGFEFDPDQCDTCEADEACDSFICSVTARHNKCVSMLNWPNGDYEDTLFENGMPTEEEQFEFYKAWILFGVICYQYFVEQEHPFVVDGELNLYTNGAAEFVKDYSKLDSLKMLGTTVSAEELMGRNFWHYSYDVRDNDLCEPYAFLDLDLSIKENEEELLDDDLLMLLPDDFWMKQYADPLSSTERHIVYFEVSESKQITDIGYIKVEVQMAGSSYYIIPGIEMAVTKTFKESNAMPWFVERDLEFLHSRKLPFNFSFINVRLPKKMIDQGGNGGDPTNYTMALQSAYRFAYTHLSIETDEKGIIKELYYSTYQSSSNSYNDMISRPVLIDDREDEAIDMLLSIYDMYTDEELEALYR